MVMPLWVTLCVFVLVLIQWTLNKAIPTKYDQRDREEILELFATVLLAKKHAHHHILPSEYDEQEDLEKNSVEQKNQFDATDSIISEIQKFEHQLEEDPDILFATHPRRFRKGKRSKSIELANQPSFTMMTAAIKVNKVHPAIPSIQHQQSQSQSQLQDTNKEYLITQKDTSIQTLVLNQRQQGNEDTSFDNLARSLEDVTQQRILMLQSKLDNLFSSLLHLYSSYHKSSICTFSTRHPFYQNALMELNELTSKSWNEFGRKQVDNIPKNQISIITLPILKEKIFIKLMSIMVIMAALQLNEDFLNLEEKCKKNTIQLFCYIGETLWSFEEMNHFVIDDEKIVEIRASSSS
jgi:hypothetical protein